VLATLEKERRSWLASLGAASPFQPLFDHLPGVCFFAKDRQGRTMFASRGVLDRYRMSHEHEILGLTDYDRNPRFMAEHYVRDDRRLLSGREKMIERLELWFDPQGLPDWFIVTKLPLIDKRGRCQGVMGVLRRAEEHEKRLPLFQTVSRAVVLMRRDFARPLIIADIAEACGESLRQLQRRFHSAFGTTPQEFLIKTRVLAAARLLEETSLTAVEIAHHCGFVDASSFAGQFRKRTGMTPTAYRSSHAGPPS
jgi:AraC-like DNA-binding protein